MQRPPRDAAALLFSGATLWLALLQGEAMLAAVLAAVPWAHARLPDPEARACAFATLVVGNLALILSTRPTTCALWAALRIPDRALWAVVGLAAALLLSALTIPWAVDVLRFAPLPAHELAAAVGLGLLSVASFEDIKWAWRQRGPLPAARWPLPGHPHRRLTVHRQRAGAPGLAAAARSPADAAGLAAAQSACLRRKAGISISSMPLLDSASTLAAAWWRLVRHTLGVLSVP
jgi:hypothetical protein